MENPRGKLMEKIPKKSAKVLRLSVVQKNKPEVTIYAGEEKFTERKGPLINRQPQLLQ